MEEFRLRGRVVYLCGRAEIKLQGTVAAAKKEVILETEDRDMEETEAATVVAAGEAMEEVVPRLHWGWTPQAPQINGSSILS